MDLYEQKYKKALEKLQEAFAPEEDGCKISGLTRGCLEYIFPELKESESERIRKELITHFRNTRCTTEEGAEKISKWIAWLEKQEPIDKDKLAKGFLRSVANTIMQYLDANTAEGKMCLSNMECEDIENAVLNADWAKVYRYMKKKLEKQDENKVYTFKSIPNPGHMLDADKVIEWLCSNSTLFGAKWCKTENIIEQFKKDFGL